MMETGPVLRISFLGVFILVCLAVVILRWLADGKLGRILLICGGVFLLLVVGWLRASHAPVREHMVAEARAATLATRTHDPEIEALWDQLTRSKINLEHTKITLNHEEAKSAAADASTETAADAQSEDPEIVATEFQGDPLDNAGQPPERPEPSWVTHEPKKVGNVYRQVVSSGPWDTREACHEELATGQLPAAILSRIEEVVSPVVGHAVQVDDLLPLGIGLDFIFRDVCREEYTKTVESESLGPMKQTYVLLEFDKVVDGQLRDAWFRYQRGRRLSMFGIAAATVLTGLAAAYSLMRFDTWTRGYYSRELLWGAVVAIIAIGYFVIA